MLLDFLKKYSFIIIISGILMIRALHIIYLSVHCIFLLGFMYYIVGNVQRRKIGHFIRAEGLIPRRLRRNEGY